MNRKRILKQRRFFSRIFLAAIAALGLGLWSPRIASATFIAETESNNSGATAQNNLNGNFSSDFDANINDNTNTNTSLTIPHVSIRATGDAEGTYDFYRFTSYGGLLILDIDSTPTGGVGSDLDTEIGLWDAAGNLLTSSDDTGFFDTGSLPGTPGFCAGTNCNSFIQTAVAAGDYIVGVCRFNCSFSSAFGISGPAISGQGFYTLHISTNTSVETPEPSAIILLGSGLVGLGYFRRRRGTTSQE